MNDQIPLPFLFNPLKHHLGWILWFTRSRREHDLPKVRSLLLRIGNSQMDLYFGALSIPAICDKILDINNRYIDNKDAYIKYILKENIYTIATLSDDSCWVLKAGDDPDRFIHIHPARYSPRTVRVRANTLKSFLAVLFIYPDKPGLKQINQVRREVLGLSPLKGISSTNGIGKLIKLSKFSYFDRFDPYETTSL